MTLTQISTAGVKDDAVTSGKIPANAVGTSEIADDAVTNAKIADNAIQVANLDASSVSTAKIQDDAVTSAKIASGGVQASNINSNAVSTDALQSNAVNTNKIADQAVTLAKLEHGTSSNNGKFLRANNGADPTFETVNTDLVSDTSPQLGGALDTNGNQIVLGDGGPGNTDQNICFGTDKDLKIYHDGANSAIYDNGGGRLKLYSNGAGIDLQKDDGEYMVQANTDAEVGLYHNGTIKFKTLSDGCQTVGRLGVNTSVPAKNLHVADSGVATVRIETTDSRGQAWDILSTNGAQNNTGTLSFRDESGSAYLEFGANGGSPELSVRNGGANDLLVVDNEGNVTKPKTPAFLAYHQSSDLNYAVGETLAYPYEVFDIGSDYNTSNSTFTAPVDGRYLFSVNANANYDSNATGIPRAYWKINGSNVGNAIHLRGSDNANTGSDADGLEQRSQTVIFNLSANDTVKVVVGQNRWDIFGANSFCGYLLG